MDKVYCLLEYDATQDIDGWPITYTSLVGVFRTFESAFAEAKRAANARKLYFKCEDGNYLEIRERTDDGLVCVYNIEDVYSDLLYAYDIKPVDVKGE